MEAPGEELTMAKFMNKPVIVDAVQLRWDNWSEMCEHAGVGEFSAGKPEGYYVDAEGRETNSNGPAKEKRVDRLFYRGA